MNLIFVFFCFILTLEKIVEVLITCILLIMTDDVYTL